MLQGTSSLQHYSKHQMNTNLKLIGIDVGGTKIAVCIATAEGEILGSTRISTSSDYKATMMLLCDKIHGLLKELNLNARDIAACGISAPGPLDVKNGTILRSPNMVWDNVPIRNDIQAMLGLPAFMENDANAGALAEWLFGAGKGKKDVVYLTMSTGVGGGVISNGHLITGTDGNAAEIGHVILDVNGPLCNCGQRGCFEAYCGGRAVQLRLQDALRFRPNHAIFKLPCVNDDFEKLNFQAVREGAKAGIPLAVEMWDEICFRLAQGISVCMFAYNPELITLGTAAYYAGDFLMTPTLNYLPRFAWPELRNNCTVALSGLGLKIGELAGASVALNAVQ